MRRRFRAMNIFGFNHAIKILLVTNALILIAGAMFGPIYAIFVEKVGGGLLDASITGGVFAIAAGITTLISSVYADKIREKKLILVWGYTFIGIGFVMYLFVKSIWSLLLVQMWIGFSEAMYYPAFDAMYSRHLDKHKEGREWGAWEAMDYFTTAFGAITGGIVVTYLGFNAIFVMMSILCFLSAAYIFFLPKKVI
jgi:MFS family permease